MSIPADRTRSIPVCGVAAVFQATSSPRSGLVERMTAVVAHRGPDGAGHRFLACGPMGVVEVGPSDPWNAALGHRRLSILDLSAAGAQPMERGHLWVTYNGEIYNYIEMRHALEKNGRTFRSGSDTEVLLAAYEEWGPACFEEFRGMWGFVLVDGRRGIAVFCRDRLGIKPLYVARNRGLTAVVSEQKQLQEFDGFSLRANESAVAAYLRDGFEDSHSTFFAGVVPVPAGTYQVLDLRSGILGEPVSYWAPERIRPEIADPNEAADEFRPVFEDAVRITLRSDVPVGFALSGGLDSSSIAVTVDALDKREDPERHSFTVTFPGFPFDERKYVDAVTRRIRTSTHFTTPAPEAFLRDLDRFLWYHDEPVGHLSQYSAYCVARLTREAGVSVTLNGQGGDEVLSGYWQTYFAGLSYLFREGKWRTLLGHTLTSLGRGGNPSALAQVPWMAARALTRLRPKSLLALKSRYHGTNTTPIRSLREMSYQEWRVFEVREFTLPRLLKWDDRNFMAFSVEGRYPFLDHQLVETCLRLKPEALSWRGWTKEPLRRALAGILPPEIERRRSKLSFEAPQDLWLKTGCVADAIAKLASSESPLWEFVERRDVQRLMGMTKVREANQALFRAFILDRWSRIFEGGGTPS
ncbi:MAG: asparagine synthase (glutamine-hydrolyzing) [Acidobacteria bacterium]|nr:asparagine synthase (glutamine-hydrolyzing) [Acidobacteriota bacterium]